MRHSNVLPVSEDVKLNETFGDDGSDGLTVIVVCGAVVSTVHVKDAALPSVLPAGSVARTSNVCEPSASPVYDCPLVQEANEPVSSLHSNVEPASVAVNEKLALVELVGLFGDVVIVVFGAPVSTAQLWVAGVASVVPAGSVARTSNVCEPSARPV